MLDDKFMRAYTVNEVSKMLDVPPGTVRQWEESLKGMLHIPRDEKGSRYYTDYELHTLDLVKNMRIKGLGFEVIRDILTGQKESELVPIQSVPVMSQSQAIQALVSLQDTVSQLTGRLEELVQDRVRQEVAVVLEENQRLHDELENRLEQRDKLLMETLRTMQESAQELQRNRKKGGLNFWPFRK